MPVVLKNCELLRIILTLSMMIRWQRAFQLALSFTFECV